MAFKYYGDLVFSTGEYKDREGKDKKSWAKAGAVFQDSESGKLSIKFEAMPVGEWSGWMKIFVKDGERSHQPMTQAQALNGGKDVVLEDIDDKPIDLGSIPF
jgi:hypothetical protein